MRMPREIVTEDGSVIEVPTDEELETLQESAKMAEELKEKVSKLEKLNSDYENDPIEKNWRALRQEKERLAEELKKHGKTIGEDGNIIDNNNKPLSIEEIESRARLVAKSEVVGHQKNILLSKFDEEKRKVVEHYFNKLTAGEEVGLESLEKYVNEAALLADPLSASKAQPFISGNPPKLSNENQSGFGSTEAGKDIANEIFGDNSFAKKQ